MINQSEEDLSRFLFPHNTHQHRIQKKKKKKEKRKISSSGLLSDKILLAIPPPPFLPSIVSSFLRSKFHFVFPPHVSPFFFCILIVRIWSRIMLTQDLFFLCMGFLKRPEKKAFYVPV
eukprot:TRINITY_DN7437_c0_g1_i1.p1 TRINITY_DN7437_c0_g1~~TRINITY_DN7437_c0_g1_i1.p1  ORF type:complete len:118 (+),score=3.00 TRINITY_DN7437_c0_g1_i1:407-760(+)